MLHPIYSTYHYFLCTHSELNSYPIAIFAASSVVDPMAAVRSFVYTSQWHIECKETVLDPDRDGISIFLPVLVRNLYYCIIL